MGMDKKEKMILRHGMCTGHKMYLRRILMEIRKEVKTYQVSYKCPECGEGELKANGMMKPSNPPYYGHTCTNRECRHKEYIFGATYPRIETEEV